MFDLEDLGFTTLLSYQAKIGAVEGVLLGAGAALALGLGYLGSRRSGARAELTQKEIDAPFQKAVYAKDINKWEDDLLAYNLQLPEGKKPAVTPPSSVIETIIRFGFTPEQYAKMGRALPFNELTGLYNTAKIAGNMKDLGEYTASLRKNAALYAQSMKDAIARFNAKTLSVLSMGTGTTFSAGKGGKVSSGIDAFQKYLDLGATDDEIVGIVSNVQPEGKKYDLDRTPKELAERLEQYRFLPHDVLDEMGILPELRLWISPEQLLEIVNVHDRLEKSGASNDEKIAIRPWTDEKDPQTGIKKIDGWKNIEDRLRRVRDVPQRTLKKLNVQPDRWILWETLSDEDKSNAFTLEAAMDLCSSDAAQGLLKDLAEQRFNLELLAIGKPMSAGGKERLGQIAKLAKSGKLAKIDKLFQPMNDDKPKTFGDLLKKKEQTIKFDLAVAAVADTNASVPDNLGQLLEFTDLHFAGKNAPQTVSERDPRKGIKRFYDRLAQQDQEWAVTEFPSEYERGKRIAPIIKDAIDYITSVVQKGDNVFIHGRDGELIYEILKKQKGFDLSKVRYAITSRPLTTEARTFDDKYKSYLLRMIPENAVHIDTGFEGSIPKWLVKKGFPVRDIKMVSANNPAEQIPSTTGLTRLQLRNIVLSDLEHSSQRLENPRNLSVKEEGKLLGGFHFLTYSDAAPGFWARLYGVEDALGIPRLRVQTGTSSEQRLRIATSPEAEEEAPVTMSKKGL